MKVDTQTRTIQVNNFDFSYSADVFVNAESFDFFTNSAWTGNAKSKDPSAYIIHNAGFVQAIVFPEYYAYCEQDALDEAADSGKLDFLQVSKKDLEDYKTGEDSEGNPEYGGIIHLGNASEPFDSENLEMFTVPVSLFRRDPIILKVVEAASRDEAADNLQTLADDEDVEMDGYNLLSRVADYLRVEVK